MKGKAFKIAFFAEAEGIDIRDIDGCDMDIVVEDDLAYETALFYLRTRGNIDEERMRTEAYGYEVEAIADNIREASTEIRALGWTKRADDMIKSMISIDMFMRACNHTGASDNEPHFIMMEY